MSQLVYRGRRDREDRGSQTSVNIFMPGMGMGVGGGLGKEPEEVERKEAATGDFEKSEGMGKELPEEYDFFSEPNEESEGLSEMEEPSTPMHWRLRQGVRRAGEFFGDLRDRWNAWRARSTEGGGTGPEQREMGAMASQEVGTRAAASEGSERPPSSGAPLSSLASSRGRAAIRPSTFAVPEEDSDVEVEELKDLLHL